MIKIKTIVISVIISFISFATLSAYAADLVRNARILDIEGDVTLRLSDGSIVPAEIGVILTQGEAIITGEGSYVLARIEGIETATIEISENSRIMLRRLTIDREGRSQNTLLDLALGKILIRADKIHSERSKFEVKTPTSVVGVRGTTFEVEVQGLD